MKRNSLIQGKLKWNNSKFLLGIASFLLTIIAMFTLYFIKGCAPFGDSSMAVMDANIQYLDLFAYLKDVISGDNSIVYTLSKGLGGTSIGVFSYYLSSPFNILVVFFEKSDLTLFIDLIIALKLGTAALFMSVFLQERFQQQLRPLFVVLLSMSYALMQYSIAQSSNIMWLDGVYMLPLMLLGVYKIVKGEKAWFLFFSTGLAILFNWYSAGINCLYTAVWFCLEWLLFMPEHKHFTKEYAISSL